MTRNKLSAFFGKEHIQLLVTLLVFFALRFPSLFEPYWYGDEGIYETIGLAMNHGRLLYSGIFDNKPPFLYITYALFSGSQFSVRLLSLIVGLCTITVFFCLAKRFFPKSRIPFITSLTFAIIFGLPLVEGNIANAENFMLLPTLGAIALAFLSLDMVGKSRRRLRMLLLFLSGTLLSITTLYKIVGVFDVTALGTFLVFFHLVSKKSLSGLSNLIRNAVFDLVPLVLGYVLPIVITCLYFLLHHAFSPFINAVFSSNIGYVGYSNAFIIPQGLLLIKLLLLVIFLGIIFLKRRQLSAAELFILIWLGFSIFNVFFSQRGYTHYALLAIPSLLLAVGYAFSSRQSGFFLAVSLVGLGLVTGHFALYPKTFPYYANFISYMTGRESVQEYRSFFDRNTPRDYDIVAFLKTMRVSPSDVFVWGNDAQIYPLTGTIPAGRYTVAYHISQYKNAISETQRALNQSKPRFIVTLGNALQIPLNLHGYMPFTKIDDSTLYERTN